MAELINNALYESHLHMRSLQIPDTYIFREGVLDMNNWSFTRLPPGRNEPKSCVMVYRMQCTVLGCEKLVFFHKIDQADYAVFYQTYPHLNPKDLEERLLAQKRIEFNKALNDTGNLVREELVKRLKK